MEISAVIIFLGLLIFFSHLANALFDKIRIPNVLLLLFIGIIIGPSTHLVSREYFGQFGSVFTTITLIVILFESGTNLRFGIIKKAILSATLLTLINFVITLIISGLVITLLTDLTWISALFIGAIIGGTSSAVVIPMVKQLKLGEKSQTILFLESSLSDVLCLVVGLALLEGIQLGAVNIGHIANQMWKDFLIAAILGAIAGFIWSLVLKYIRNFKGTMFTSFALVFIIYGLVELIGLNGGIATLLFGVVIGNSESISGHRWFRKVFTGKVSDFNLTEKDFFFEVVFIVQTYFFVYVGISIQFGDVFTYLTGALLALLIILTRPFVIRLMIRKEVSHLDRSFMSIMTPKGLVPAVMASLPLFMGLPGGAKIQDIGYAVVLFSILFCSILVIIISKDPLFLFRITHKKGKDDQEADTIPEQHESSVQKT